MRLLRNRTHFIMCLDNADCLVCFNTYLSLKHMQHTATHCNTLQHTATHCNTLQHTATHCNTSPTQTYRQTLRNVRVVAKGVGTDFLIYIDMCITHIYWQTLRNMRVVWKKCWSRSKLFLISSLPIR